MIRRRLARYARTVHVFWRDAETTGDFLRLMQVRLANSRGVGRVVCPRPVVARVAMASFGGEIALRSHTTDVSVLMEILVSDVLAPLRRHAPSGPRTVVDLGANTGLVARRLLAMWAGCRLVAVEPEPGNVAVLRENLASPEVAGRATVVAACVGAERRSVSLGTTTGEHGFRMREAHGSQADEQLVEVVTMTDVLAAGGFTTVDVLKCDIEGAEVELFEDCSPWIGDVDTVMIECHDGLGADGLTRMIGRGGGALDVRDRRRDERLDLEFLVLRRALGAAAGR